MNTVTLYGRNCQDLELMETGKGKDANCYVRFNIAINEGRDKDGEQITQFVPCIAWGKLAETLCLYVCKGDRLVVQGRLNIQKYTEKGEEKPRTSVQVILSKVDFVETKADDEEEEPVKSPKRKR